MGLHADNLRERKPVIHVGMLFTNEDEDPETYGWKIEQNGFATPEERLEAWNAYKAQIKKDKREFFVARLRTINVWGLLQIITDDEAARRYVEGSFP